MNMKIDEEISDIRGEDIHYPYEPDEKKMTATRSPKKKIKSAR